MDGTHFAKKAFVQGFAPPALDTRACGPSASCKGAARPGLWPGREETALRPAARAEVAAGEGGSQKMQSLCVSPRVRHRVFCGAMGFALCNQSYLLNPVAALAIIRIRVVCGQKSEANQWMLSSRRGAG